MPLIENLQKMLKERRQCFQNFTGKTDIVQLLLQQDESRQKNENVSIYSNKLTIYLFLETTTYRKDYHCQLLCVSARRI